MHVTVTAEVLDRGACRRNDSVRSVSVILQIGDSSERVTYHHYTTARTKILQSSSAGCKRLFAIDGHISAQTQIPKVILGYERYSQFRNSCMVTSVLR